MGTHGKTKKEDLCFRTVSALLRVQNIVAIDLLYQKRVIVFVIGLLRDPWCYRVAIRFVPI